MAITKSSSDPVAIITGGASGIGLSVTTRLVELGWNVMILDFNEGPGQIVASKFGRKVAFLKVDVKDYEQQASAFVETWNKWSRLDFVFANAVSHWHPYISHFPNHSRGMVTRSVSINQFPSAPTDHPQSQTWKSFKSALKEL